MDTHFLSFFSVLLITCVFLFGFLKKLNEWYYISRLGEKKHRLPPGTMGWPLIGNMWSFLRAFKSQNPDSFISNLASRYDGTGIYKTHLFWSPAVIVCTAESCRKVLVDNEHFKLGYPSSAKQLFGRKSLHSVTSSEHKRLRRLIAAPIYGHDALSMYVGYVEDILIHGLDELASMDRPIEFFNEIKRVTFKVITQIFVGSSVDSIDLMSTVRCYTDITDGLMSPGINLPGFAFHRALKARKVLVKLLQAVLEERRERSKNGDLKKMGMMDLLMEIEDETGQKLEDEDIIDLLLLFLLAGHESSARVAMWATIHLHDNPEMLQKAKEEQEEILKRRPSSQKGLTVQEIRQMEYLAKVIDETLRKRSFFIICREAKVDVNINGYLVPKGWKVLVWNREVHMDPENYPNPKDFNPSRWDIYEPKPRSFIPFGGGSRICPGADLAKIKISIFLHYFLLNYKLEQVNPNGPVVYLTDPRPADNCLAKVIKLS